MGVVYLHKYSGLDINHEVQNTKNELEGKPEWRRTHVKIPKNKVLQQKCIVRIQKLREEIWEQEQIPEEWMEAIICPLYTQGDKVKCQNYKKIGLPKIVYKEFAIILKKWLEDKMETLGEYQWEFGEWILLRKIQP